jgi:bifunctional DNase/RNase
MRIQVHAAGLSCLLLASLWGWSCTGESGEEIEVHVQSVALDPTSRSPVLLLEDDAGEIALPIWIGPAEAQAIAMQIEGVSPPRPMTHDLMKDILDRVGVRLVKVVIADLRDNTYYARILLDWAGEEVEIDSRPSDAVALAVRFGQPIFVTTGLLEVASAIDLRAMAGTETVTLWGVTVQALSSDLASHFSLPAGGGLLVADVASDAGGALMRGDVILSIDGSPVAGLREFERKLRPVRGATLRVQRGENQIDVAFTAIR